MIIKIEHTIPGKFEHKHYLTDNFPDCSIFMGTYVIICSSECGVNYRFCLMTEDRQYSALVCRMRQAKKREALCLLLQHACNRIKFKSTIVFKKIVCVLYFCVVEYPFCNSHNSRLLKYEARLSLLLPVQGGTKGLENIQNKSVFIKLSRQKYFGSAVAIHTSG